MASKNQFNPPPLRKITDFKSQLTGGGARSNLFECVLSFPEIAQVENDVLNKSRFLIKAANLPASNVAFIDVPFRGRTLKVAGDRTFESWTITVINDTDFAIRSAFENWINKINRVSDGTGELDPNAYTKLKAMEMAQKQLGLKRNQIEKMTKDAIIDLLNKS